MNGLNKAKCVMSPRGACATLDKRFPALVYHHAVGARLAVYVSYTGPFLVFFFFTEITCAVAMSCFSVLSITF